jgi:peptide/nickel transport system permease protein
MPDSTHNANDGAVELQRKPPMFQATLIKERKDFEIAEVNFFLRMFIGTEKPFLIVPVSKYRIEFDKVYYTEYADKSQRRKELKQKEKYRYLVNVVKSVYANQSTKLNPNGDLHYIDGKYVVYLDMNENVQKVLISDLQKEFKENHIEKRTYYLGTDKAGRDLLSRLLFGTRISLAIGFVSLLISLIVGITLGAIAGFFGGFVDNIVNWLMTVVWSIPSIMLVIAISLALQSKGVWVAFVAVGLTMWVDIARVVRGEILTLKQKLFVEAARAFGLTSWRIIYRHILPNMLGSLIVISSSNFASAILVEAGLSFLGLGVQPPMPSWGMMVNEGFHLIGNSEGWHLIVFPSVAISLLVLAFNLLGNGLRDAYDPKTLMK